MWEMVPRVTFKIERGPCVTGLDHVVTADGVPQQRAEGPGVGRVTTSGPRQKTNIAPFVVDKLL